MIERMILSEEECVAKTVLPNKITVIIPTCQSERKILMWSLLSLILRTQTKKDQIEHYIIGINGPDARTGDPVLQDEKQAMMEELRDKFDVPITVQRVWSRVGHGEVIDSAIPWVHTNQYLVIHDDIILLDREWLDKLDGHNIPDVCASTATKPMSFFFREYPDKESNEFKLNIPHLNPIFILCKKTHTQGLTWKGYHVPQERLLTKRDIDDLTEHWKNAHPRFPKDLDEVPMNFISYELGCWFLERLRQNGHRINMFDENTICHLVGMSWHANKENALDQFKEEISNIEKEISDSRFADFYERWK